MHPALAGSKTNCMAQGHFALTHIHKYLAICANTPHIIYYLGKDERNPQVGNQLCSNPSWQTLFSPSLFEKWSMNRYVS